MTDLLVADAQGGQVVADWAGMRVDDLDGRIAVSGGVADHAAEGQSPAGSEYPARMIRFACRKAV